MNDRGIVLLGEDAGIERHADAVGLAVMQGSYGPPPFARTLFVQAGTTVPWALLPAAWHFLERWDAAVPLWRYGVLAANVGRAEERKRTRRITLDLRVLLYAHELLFVRDNDAGQALMETFVEELAGSEEPRLAFLRAFYSVKPRLCVLPRSWLADVHEASRVRRRHKRPRQARLVQVEVEPGRFVQCHKGDEQKVLEMLRSRRRR